MRKRFIALVGATVIAGSLVIGGAVNATSTSGQAAGDCRMGHYTSNDQAYGGVVAQVTVNKQCVGPVEGRFTTNIFRYAFGRIPGGLHSTSIVMRATCAGTGGFASPCTVGQVVTASPGPTSLSVCNTDAGDNCMAGVGTRGMNMVWPSLSRGVWTFEVEATAAGSDWVRERTFTVEAFNP